MIIHNNLEFHAAELKAVPLGQQLLRIPQFVGDTLNPRAKFVVHDSVGTEIRFVSDAPNVRIYLSAIKPEFGFEEQDVRIMRGDFDSGVIRLKEGVVTSRMLSQPPVLDTLTDDVKRAGDGVGFSSNVWRLMSDRGGFIFCGIETFGHEIRPPLPEEKPSKVCLCHGSSITNSSANGYPAVLGRRLGVDVINTGLSGSSFLEKAIADWMAKECDWDCATLELGTNMTGGFSPEEFKERAEYLVETMVENNRGKPIFLITIFPSFNWPQFRNDTQPNDHVGAFNQITREIAASYQSTGHVHLVEGEQMLDQFTALSSDGIHPGMYGQILMGLNLARLMEQKL